MRFRCVWTGRAYRAWGLARAVASAMVSLMENWILLALAAAAFQTLRFMLQKSLSMGQLSVGGATLARFVFALPFILPLALLIVLRNGLPQISAGFWQLAMVGGLGQILATWCVVALFAERNFAVGITFKKTEVLLTAVVGLIFLGDRISLPGTLAILLGFIGVLLLSRDPGHSGKGWRDLTGRATLLGVASGICFAISAVAYRAATLEIASPDPLVRAALALAVVTLMQSAALSAWLAWRDPGQVGRVLAARAKGIWIGLTGMAGSLCWFTAFTLQNAALVFAVGQVEVIFSLIAAVLVFGERISRREAGGIVMLTLSVLGVVLYGQTG